MAYSLKDKGAVVGVGSIWMWFPKFSSAIESWSIYQQYILCSHS
jgi:hypothetical protein